MALPVAGAATGNVQHAAHVIFFYQGHAEIGLVRVALAVDRNRVRTVGWTVMHVEHLVAGTQIILRLAVTAHAPAHLQRFLLIHQRHAVDRSVAGVATDSLVDVNAVIEVHKIWKLVDARPLQRFSAAVAGADWFKQLSVGPDLRMAVHAGAGRRYTSERGGFDRSVAIAAVDAESGDVVLVAKRDRLRFAHAGISNVRRALNFVPHPPQRSYDEDRAENCGTGQCVRAAMKDLRHADDVLAYSASLHGVKEA